jgi:hypothetical protein
LTTLFGVTPALRAIKTGTSELASTASTLARGAVQEVKDIASGLSLPDVSGIAQKIATPNIDKIPANIMQRVARIPKLKQAKFEKLAGETVGEYLTKRGIFGDVDKVTEQLYTRFSKSMNTADEALDTLEGTFEPTSVKTALKELVARETRVSAEGAVSPNLTRATELLSKIEKKGLTMKEINEAKRLYERNVKVDYLKSASANPEAVVRATNIDSAIRQWQLKQAETLGLKNLGEINKETQLARQLMNDLGTEYSGQAGNNAVSLTDWIMLSGGDPTAIAGFLTKKTLSSKSVQSAIAKYLNKGNTTLGEVKADIGTSNVKQLPAGSNNPSIQNFVAPELPTRSLPNEPMAQKIMSQDKVPVKATTKKAKSSSDSSLINEARKYKSAEEFVKAQKPISHYTSQKFDKFDLSKTEAQSVWFTDNPKIDLKTGQGLGSAQVGAGGVKYKMDRYINPKSKIIDIEKSDLTDKYTTGQLIDMGYSGVKVPQLDGSNWYEIWEPNKDLITKSQLTDIWKKANKK